MDGFSDLTLTTRKTRKRDQATPKSAKSQANVGTTFSKKWRQKVEFLAAGEPCVAISDLLQALDNEP